MPIAEIFKVLLPLMEASPNLILIHLTKDMAINHKNIFPPVMVEVAETCAPDHYLLGGRD